MWTCCIFFFSFSSLSLSILIDLVSLRGQLGRLQHLPFVPQLRPLSLKQLNQKLEVQYRLHLNQTQIINHRHSPLPTASSLLPLLLLIQQSWQNQRRLQLPVYCFHPHLLPSLFHCPTNFHHHLLRLWSTPAWAWKSQRSREYSASVPCLDFLGTPECDSLR